MECHVRRLPNYLKEVRFCFAEGHNHAAEKDRVLVTKENFDAWVTNYEGYEELIPFHERDQVLDVLSVFQGTLLTQAEAASLEKPVTMAPIAISNSTGSRSRKRTVLGQRSFAARHRHKLGKGARKFSGSRIQKSKSTATRSKSSPGRKFVPPVTQSPSSESKSLSFVELLKKRRAERETLGGGT